MKKNTKDRTSKTGPYLEKSADKLLKYYDKYSGSKASIDLSDFFFEVRIETIIFR